MRFSDEQLVGIDECATVNNLCAADIVRMGVDLILATNRKRIKLKGRS